jgi:hypothetical protein
MLQPTDSPQFQKEICHPLNPDATFERGWVASGQDEESKLQFAHGPKRRKAWR